MASLPDHERVALGDVVRQLRAREGMSQEEVADRAGFNRKYVSDLESGRRRTTWDGVVLVSRAMGVTLAEVVELYEARIATRGRRS